MPGEGKWQPCTWGLGARMIKIYSAITGIFRCRVGVENSIFAMLEGKTFLQLGVKIIAPKYFFLYHVRYTKYCALLSSQ